MGNFSRNTFDRLKHYVSVRLQQGVPIVDADWNELQDIRRHELEAFLKWFVGNGVPLGNNGFALGAIAMDNSFTIADGRCLVDGWEAVNDWDEQHAGGARLPYTSQPLFGDAALAAQWGVAPLPPLTTPGAQRTDTVYLDVWQREVGAAEDAQIVNPAIGIETSVRTKREWVVRVAEGTVVPAPAAGHAHYPLATLNRATGDARIALNQITDLRRTGLSLADLNERTSRLEAEKVDRAGDSVTGDLQVSGRLAVDVGPITGRDTAITADTVSDSGIHKYGVLATAGSDDNAMKHGLYGLASGDSGTKFGVYGLTGGNSGIQYGVHGSAAGTGGTKYGLSGIATGAGNKYGLNATATGNDDDSKYGARVTATGAGGTKYGLYCTVNGTGGNKNGIYTSVSGDDANQKQGIYANVSGDDGNKYGVRSNVSGDGGNKFGVYGQVTGTGGSKYGVYGYANSNDSDPQYGVYAFAGGDNGTMYGVYSRVNGNFNTKTGFYSYVTGTGNKTGVYGVATGNDTDPTKGVIGVATGSGGVKTGVQAQGNGDGNTVYGLYATAAGTGGLKYSIYGNASSDGAEDKYGVYAKASGEGGTKYGIHASASGGGGTNWAGYFDGNLHVTGTLTKGSGTFCIDHVLDPDNKVLRHSFVESPEDLCLYRGKVSLDPSGKADVDMPEYFAALTDEEQATVLLTPIGDQPGLLSYTWHDDHTRFSIHGEPGSEVSYLILANRDDPVIRLLRRPVEEDKTAAGYEKGKLLYPEAFGRPPATQAMREEPLPAELKPVDVAPVNAEEPAGQDDEEPEKNLRKAQAQAQAAEQEMIERARAKVAKKAKKKKKKS